MSPRQLPLVPETPPARVYRRISMDDVRENFAAAEPDPAFTRSLQDFGLINPIMVEERSGKFEIIAGRRRYLAAKALEWESIPAMVVQATGWRSSVVLSLVENEQRTPNKQAALRAANRLLEAGYEEKDIARAIGMPLGSLRKLMKLNQLVDGLQEMLADGRMAEGVAEKAASLPKKAQQALARLEKVTGPDVHNARLVETSEEAQAVLAEIVADTPDQPYDWKVDVERELRRVGELVHRQIDHSGKGDKQDYIVLMQVLKGIRDALTAITEPAREPVTA